MTEYASVEEFKAWVTVRGGTASTDAADDLVIRDILASVSIYIEEQTGRRFWKSSSDETRYYQTDKSYRCEVDDLVSVTTISVDYSNVRSYTDFVAADYELEPFNASLKSKPYTDIYMAPSSAQYFPEYRRGVRVVGKFGWPSIPSNIKSSCLAIAHNIWMGRSGQTGSGRVTVTAAGVVIRPEDVPPMVQQDLLTYRNIR